MTVLFSAIFPIIFIVIIGATAGKKLDLHKTTLSKLIVYILFPALVTDSLYTTNMSSNSMLRLLLGVFLISLILYILVSWLRHYFKISTAIYKSLIATTLHPNNGNMGLPLIEFALGSAGLERAVIYMIGSSILLFVIMPALLAGTSFKNSMQMIFKLPLVWAMLLGIILRVLHVELTFNLYEVLNLLGRSSIPIALIVLGMELRSTKFKITSLELISLNLRLILAPFIALCVGGIIGLKDLDLQVLILQSAMPTAISTAVLSTEFGGEVNQIVRTIILTTIFSFLTLPVILWLIN